MENQIINTCYISSQLSSNNIRVIANYSHYIPIVISTILAILIFVKSKFNLFSKVFFFFILSFCTWLLGDVLAWTSNNYSLVYSIWSILVFIEIISYIFATYFVILYSRQKDISVFLKLLMILIVIPPFLITILGQSVTGFDHSVCEAYNNKFLDIYKLVTEILLLLIIFWYALKDLFIKNLKNIKISKFLVPLTIFLFLLIFGGSEFYAAETGIYEYNLYSLFLLPVLILVIIYAVFELDIFNFDILGTQYLVVGLIILMFGQLFFVNNSTDVFLTVVTLVLSVVLGVILFRNLKKETDQRLKIQSLSEQLETYNQKLKTTNDRLKVLDKMKTEFVSLASHQLRSPLTAIKGYTSMLLEGDYGELNLAAKQTVERVMESSNNLTLVVEDLLNVSKIEQGGMKYDMAKFDFAQLVEETAKELSITAQKKSLDLTYKIVKANSYFVNGDKEKLRQILVNIIDNAMKYTKQNGKIEINLDINKNKNVLLSISDTGIGISKEGLEDLFKKFSRGEGSKMNASGSGLGLYLVKEIVEAHKGRVWVESEGEGKGSIFFVELSAVS